MLKELASEDEVRAVIEDAYPEFTGCEISIGFLGDTYRIMVKDPCDVWHTIKVPFRTMQSAIASVSPGSQP